MILLLMEIKNAFHS